VGRMDRDDPELDNALRHLTGCGFYRDNVFRITGLPTDASPAQIRRRREEANLAERLGTTLAPGASDLPRQPSPTSDELRTAFESLRNPVLRLVHEMLWLWRYNNDAPRESSGSAEHDAAVRSHCMALEAEYAGSSPESESPDITWLDRTWAQSMAAWATVLFTEEMWDWAKRRVEEIGDARLTTGTVRRLRTKLPLHIVAVNADLAARAAENGDDDADRHLRLLYESPFERTLVDRALRTAARPAEERVPVLCAAARSAVQADRNEAAEAAARLLDEARPLLRVVDTLLGSDDPLTRALHDEVASSVNACSVAYYNATDRGRPAVDLLRHAQGFARERPTIDLVRRNLEVIEEGVLVAEVAQLCEKGWVEAAAARLRAWRRKTNDDQWKERLTAFLSDPRALRSPISSAPSRVHFYGCGVEVYGRRSPADDGTYIATHFITLLFIPVIPLAAHLRNSTHIYAKVPLSALARWWRRLVVMLILVIVALSWGGVWAVFAVLALAVLYMLGREYRLRVWVSQRTAG
jgi:hypothetical protein